MDQITEIPLEQLHESPFNPRKTFVAIDELATDIKAQDRVLSPLLVRPRFTNPLRDDQVDGYEIVFGHRRYRAAELAGLATVPCMVRAMTVEEAKRAQISENLQRKDVHPIEEAEGFQALMDDHGITAEQIVEQTGKSRSYVYGRLKLLQAVPKVRDACLAGEIGSEVALLVARLRTEKLQTKALEYISKDYSAKLNDGGKQSYRSIRNLLNDKFTLELGKALFDTADALLVPEAGDCITCTKRTGNAPEFVDIAEPDQAKNGYGMREDYIPHDGPDVCTDPDCFEAKKKQHLRNEAAKLEQSGKIVVEGNKARAAISNHGEIKGGFIALKHVKAAIKKAKASVDVVHIQDPRTGKMHEAVRAADLKTAAVVVKEPKPKNGGSPNYAAERSEREQLAKARTASNMALIRRIREAQPAVPGIHELRMVASCLLELVADSDDEPTLRELWPHVDSIHIEHRLDALEAAELTRLVLDCTLIGHSVCDGWYGDHVAPPDNLVNAAEHYGVPIDPPAADHDEPADEAQPEGAAA